MIEHVGSQTIREMRSWIADCEWKDVDDVDTLTDQEVIAGIDRHYDGGVHAFLNHAADHTD